MDFKTPYDNGPCFNAKVVDKLPEKGDEDDVYIVPNYPIHDVFVWVSGEFVGVCNCADSIDMGCSETHKTHIPTNCKNCGAPLKGNKCLYCGTEY